MNTSCPIPQSTQMILLNNRTGRKDNTYVAARLVIIIDQWRARVTAVLITTLTALFAHKLGDAFGAWCLVGKVLIALFRSIPGLDYNTLAAAILYYRWRGWEVDSDETDPSV